MTKKVDFLSQIADYLAASGMGETNEANGTVNIFAGIYPADPDDAIAILGLVGSTLPNINIPDFEYPRFQIVVRNNDYETASQVLRDVRTLLHDKLAVTLTNFYCLYIQAQQDGFPIGQDDKGRYEFSINFSAQIRYADSFSG